MLLFYFIKKYTKQFEWNMYHDFMNSRILIAALITTEPH
jgi:hypothetical protein